MTSILSHSDSNCSSVDLDPQTPVYTDDDRCVPE